MIGIHLFKLRLALNLVKISSIIASKTSCYTCERNIRKKKGKTPSTLQLDINLLGYLKYFVQKSRL